MAEAKSRLDWRLASEVIWRALVFIIAAAILLVVVTRWNRWQGAAGWQQTDDAFLQADLTPIAAKVPGYVTNIPVQDFQRVKAGQLIAQIYDTDYKATVAQAQAQAASATAQAEALKAQIVLQGANVEAAKAVVSSTSAALAQNSRDLARQRKLLETGSSSTEATEKLQTGRLQLSAQLAQNKAQADASARQLGVLAAQVRQAQAAIAAAHAALDLAQINLGYTRVVAPQDGVLAQRQIKPGQYVGVGTQVTSLTPLPNVWVIANYKETQLTHMAVGEKAEVRVDAYPDHVMKGHVIAFAPGSGAQFALLPPDNATGNFTKVVQRVAVKILIDDPAGLADRLRPGLSVIARVDARAEDHR
ncbi:MAG TPA: HlyD family secretion protein [Caulobacteraceae bacterium]|jgi:membrane fusion protein (multidrug efflux system)|nr:HlyD family secretion protein [Caulobacteraceae bacterium]